MDCQQCGAELEKDAKACACGWKAKSGISAPLLILLLVCGACFLAAPVAVIAAIAIPNMIDARMHGNEAGALGALMTITSAQAFFREADKDGNGVSDFGSLQQLADTRLIDPVLGTGTKQGYLFTCTASSTSPESAWSASASPVAPGTTGNRFFGVTQDGVIFASETGPVGFDPEGQPLGDAIATGR